MYTGERVSTANDVDIRLSNKGKHITLWNNPVLTTCYASCEIFLYFKKTFFSLMRWKKPIFAIVLSIFTIEIFHLKFNYSWEIYRTLRSNLKENCYWVILGILSSIGLGTGLHTFVLYLGPFVAMVTIAAWECSSLNFPEPPYPKEIICPDYANYPKTSISLWMIYRKVFLEAFMWGIGTAIGETPPYFVAKTARLYEDKNASLNEEFDSLMEISFSQMSYMEKVKYVTMLIISKMGFWGIVVLSSFPNPLFDIAGLTCGHCLVSFKTFFSAIFIGKAIFKVTIQTVFVILSFSPEHINSIITLLKTVPLVGNFVSDLISRVVVSQKEKFHTHQVKSTWISRFFQGFITLTLIFFVISAINALAQAYLSRVSKSLKKCD